MDDQNGQASATPADDQQVAAAPAPAPESAEVEKSDSDEQAAA